ncbi:MAG: glycosyltransferase family 4 protein [Minisyncoccia bacterium]|jgi:glycosyltransferase involved in cell wall biosynthesis
MTIHFFTKGDERLGDSRQRAFRIADELNARGITSVVHWPPVMFMSTTPWPKKFLLIAAVIRSLFSIKKGDIVFLQRTIGNKYFFVIMIAYLKFFRRKMVFDFDDAIYMHDFYKTKTFTHMANAVIVCSQALAAWVRRYNNTIHIVHTSLKFSAYAKFTKNYSVESEPMVIGWVGRATDHCKNLEFLATILEELLKKTTIPFTFKLVGAMQDKKVYALFERISGLQVEFVDNLDWNNPEVVPRVIQTFDIGVMPLVEKGEWNLARSSFKPLEYMACGVAAVCSAVGEITHVIQDGVNGYLANDKVEWVGKLEELLSDRELRARFGRVGQAYVRDNDCYEVIIPKMIKIFQALN